MGRRELNVGPLFTISESSGQVATRAWAVDTEAECIALIKELSAEPFPLSGFENCYPSEITMGAFDATSTMTSTQNGMVEVLPTYSAYKVTAQYQFMRDRGDYQNVKWPDFITKPDHPTGTTLTLKIRNSGEFMTFTATNGTVVNDQGAEAGVLSPHVSMVVLIPIREYHITCGRLLDYQIPDYRDYEGKVNSDSFLDCDSETLLCETVEVTQTFAADLDDPQRYQVTAILRERKIRDGSRIRGWNHEYNNGNGPENPPGWYRVKLSNGDARYPAIPMRNMFNVTY